MPDLTRLDTYDYELPPELIAQAPLAERDSSRLLVIDRAAGTFQHRTMRDFPDLLQPADCLVLNDSRVVPARLTGRRIRTGGRWEGLYLGLLPEGDWKLIGQTRGRLEPGEQVTIPAPDSSGEDLSVLLVERLDGGMWRARPLIAAPVFTLLERFGSVPLPSYIHHGTEEPGDRERYQTVYATAPGSAAAPTAGLHFTPELLERCHNRGIERAQVTLHVGLGTFRPVNVDDIREHQMHAETCSATPATMQRLQQIRQAGGRVLAVGTTSLRTLETAHAANAWQGWSGESRIFIYPPYEFGVVNALLTNFHLPKSTLLMLVSAFAGYDLVRAAYAEAIRERYRFFSYGDAMLIL